MALGNSCRTRTRAASKVSPKVRIRTNWDEPACRTLNTKGLTPNFSCKWARPRLRRFSVMGSSGFGSWIGISRSMSLVCVCRSFACACVASVACVWVVSVSNRTDRHDTLAVSTHFGSKNRVCQSALFVRAGTGASRIWVSAASCPFYLRKPQMVSKPFP